jgi:PleD family two-component response regulator
LLSPHAEHSLDSLLKLADRALQEAKRGGRNRVHLHAGY